MRTARIVQLGRPPEPAEVEEPEPAAGEVAVTVEAVALNPLDLSVGNGVFYGGHPPLPYPPGCEAGGRTDDGDVVYLFGGGRGVSRPGFLARRVTVPAGLPLRLPGRTDPVIAAMIGIAGVAAWVSVVWKAEVGPDDRVVVLGASGAVGLVAVQAAKLRGAHVTAAGRTPARLELARELGADEVTSLDAIPDGFTVCIDPLWGKPLAAALAKAAPRARIVHLGQSAGPEAPLRSADVRGKELRVLGHSSFLLTDEERNRAYLELLEQVAAGRVRVPFDRYALDDVAAAWARQADGPGGKVVVEL